MPTLMSRRALLAQAGALALVLAACGGDDDQATDATTATPPQSEPATPASAAPAETAPAAAGGFPRTIDHALGSSEIAAAPQRPMALTDFGDLDNLLALDVKPVLFGYTNSWDTGVSPWQAAAGIDQLEQYTLGDSPSIETIVGASPDLIVSMVWPAEDVYDQLSAVAPVVSMGWDATWREQLTLVGSAIGKEAEAATKADEIQVLITATKERLTKYADLTFMVGSYFGDVLYVQGVETATMKLLVELGLTVKGGPEPALTSLSLEQVDILADADVLLSLATDPDATKAAEASGLWAALPAVVAGRYTAIPSVESRSIGDSFNALSASWALPKLEEIIIETAEARGRPLG